MCFAREMGAPNLLSCIVWHRQKPVRCMTLAPASRRRPNIATHPPHPITARSLRIVDLIRPHWQALTLALVAVVGETLTDILEPWPIKIVVDNILQSKPITGWLGGIVTRL